MKIAKDTLSFILEVCKSSAPLEFAGMLQADGDVITEVVVVPGTSSSENSAVMQLFMLPNIHTVGTVHSHPSGNRRPSGTDLELFTKKGNYHIIVGAPYNTSSWTCYNKKGETMKLEVVDYDFGDEMDIF
ncbi:MAG: Mov34/MPN/PAD-1 family protein [Candidatus Methanoperedens sp.]|jgi:proteasome lid subunit RPN8/RPN11|nr:Mov34/MPN/PAD-1 family protein [Candidatus Methanoperedens sp.]PKL53863.1 MAG: metal-dependent protease of the PAD1/JAB1 superfamily [Candidatus Methanoperedenaceae archaeon HGW-Methanoperedenaceae-1]